MKPLKPITMTEQKKKELEIRIDKLRTKIDQTKNFDEIISLRKSLSLLQLKNYRDWESK